jgi:hypothetical protein
MATLTPTRRGRRRAREVEGVDALFARLPQGVEVFEGPHDTFYGMREFIVRDSSGFWLTFGEPLNPVPPLPP